MLSEIRVSCSPHISKPLSTRTVMIDVVIGLVPMMIAAGYFYRKYALVLIPVCVVSCVLTEWLCNVVCKKSSSVGDFSAVVTGIILAFSVPPTLPAWAAVVGSVFAITIGKMVFGGLGGNIFNPAMVGRAFLVASLGTVMATWTVPASVDPNMSRIRPDNFVIDTVYGTTQATPLAWSKMAIKDKLGAPYYSEKQLKVATLGEVGGCLGETSVIAILIGGAYLLIRRTIGFHIPVAVLLSAFIFAGIAYKINPDAYVPPTFHLASGALLFGAFFIATDPVTAPLTRRGMWIFGAGVGSLTMLIRIVGDYPEGFMFSILLMNAVTPLIDRLCKCVPAGGKPGV